MFVTCTDFFELLDLSEEELDQQFPIDNKARVLSKKRVSEYGYCFYSIIDCFSC